MRILVVCGAGASSTFVAHRIRRSAAARGLDVTVIATSQTELEALRGADDVILIGAHLAALREPLVERGAAVAVMPDAVFAASDGAAALDLALGLRAGAAPPRRLKEKGSTHG